MRRTGLEVITALADRRKRPQELIRIVFLPAPRASSSTAAAVPLRRQVLILGSTLTASAMPPADLLLSSRLVDLALAGPLPPHRRNDDKYDTDEEYDDAEGRERDDDPLLFLALVPFLIGWIGGLFPPAKFF